MSEILLCVLLICGALFIFIAAVGLLRMPDLFMRLACTAKSATLGLGLLLCGLAWYFGELDITSRALATIFFLLLTTPVATHRIARVAYLDGIRLWEGTFLDELKGRYDVDRNLASGHDSQAENRQGKN
jgi:multicomponent Na+:H+ antiporter subunit G